jgi:hypothetical protein
MLGLIISIFIGWLLLRWLWPREPVYIEPPPPPLQITIHLHRPVIVVTSALVSKAE